jgi:hypothetical protein|nr:MAG TPA: chromosomal replication initiator protein [Caudoviricetes sp.]
MEFMICNPDGLCRSGSESGYDECLKNDKWCVDGYAAGAFMGFESGTRISEEEAVEFIVKEHGLDKESAKQKLTEQGLSKEESIEYMRKTFGYSPKAAAKALGLNIDMVKM